MASFISQKWLLNRRHVLRGLGISLALPLLDCMTPLRAAENQKRPRRSVFMSLNFALQFTKSAAWPSMARLIISWFAERKYGRVWGIISTSSRFSAMISALLLAALLLLLPWRAGFFVVGGGVALIVVLLFLCLKVGSLGFVSAVEAGGTEFKEK